MKYNVKDFSNEEKLKLIMGKDCWRTNDLDNKIPSVIVTDGPQGVRTHLDLKNGLDLKDRLPSTLYPCSAVLSQTWNLDLAREYGEAIGNDVIEKGIDLLLAPALNIKRTPLCGRNFEYFSEDPLIAGKMAKAYVEGVQSQHIGTCIKHFCANNYEFARNWLSSEIDERTLNEIYLEGFKIACEAKPWSLMCSYNIVDGIRMSENDILYAQLRNEFGFDGLIMSDWAAVKNANVSYKAGLDLEMPYDDKHRIEREEALKEGKIDVPALDNCAQHVLDLVTLNEKEKKVRKLNLSNEERDAIALKVAEEGIVLVKNCDKDGNPVLPLKKGVKIAVEGNSAKYHVFGGGSGEVTSNIQFLSLDKALEEEGYKARLARAITGQRSDGVYVDNTRDLWDAANEADVILLSFGDEQNNECEAKDRVDIKLPGEQVEFVKLLARLGKKIILSITAGSVMDLTEVYDLADAILISGYAGQEYTKALSRIISGKVNPSGRLTETYAFDLDDYPSTGTYRDLAVAVYEEGLNVGYRYFTTYDVPVLFPFGYGLSYSEFEYKSLKVKQVGDREFDVEVEIENTSDVDGKEVVQLYVSELLPAVYRPTRELKAFDKVFIKAHSKAKVKLHLDENAFHYYSELRHKWVVNPGMFSIQICSDAETVELEQKVEVK